MTTLDDDLDVARLETVRGRILALMSDHRPHTLEEIAESLGSNTQAVGASMRDLRKGLAGAPAYEVISERVGDPKSGRWEHRLTGRVLDRPEKPDKPTASEIGAALAELRALIKNRSAMQIAETGEQYAVPEELRKVGRWLVGMVRDD